MSKLMIVGLLVSAACAKAPSTQPETPLKTVAADPDAPAAAPTPVVTQTQAVPAPLAGVVKSQPPHIKLKLGHFRNEKLGIGVVIDLTEQTENVADIDPAKIRFDGDDKIYRLEGQHGGRDRIDYMSGKSVMLQVWEDGTRVVFVPDPTTGRSSDDIRVTRDGDSDPL